MNIDILDTSIPVEKKKQILLTAGRPAVGMLLLGQWEKKVPYIHSVFVSKAHRRKGVGRMLVKAAMGLATKTRKVGVNLWVDKRNAQAIALYESEGFNVVGDDNPVMMNCQVGRKARR